MIWYIGLFQCIYRFICFCVWEGTSTYGFLDVPNSRDDQKSQDFVPPSLTRTQGDQLTSHGPPLSEYREVTSYRPSTKRLLIPIKKISSGEVFVGSPASSWTVITVLITSQLLVFAIHLDLSRSRWHLGRIGGFKGRIRVHGRWWQQVLETASAPATVVTTMVSETRVEPLQIIEGVKTWKDCCGWTCCFWEYTRFLASNHHPFQKNKSTNYIHAEYHPKKPWHISSLVLISGDCYALLPTANIGTPCVISKRPGIDKETVTPQLGRLIPNSLGEKNPRKPPNHCE